MVSSALGERFGSGNHKAGSDFIEKIVQIPLHIPVAQPEALEKFCFDRIEMALSENNITISDIELKRFTNAFSINFKDIYTTPRLAVRYSNSISFTLSLVLDEVNLVDHMLIEAIKIFYPSFYEFIKSNPSYFLDSYKATYSNEIIKTKIDELNHQFSKISESLSNNQKRGILNILKELFPVLEVAFSNNNTYYDTNKDINIDWYNEKRIASRFYFSRYFSFGILAGEISDHSFNKFIVSIHTLTTDQIVENLNLFIHKSSEERLLHKISNQSELYNWEVSKQIVLGLAAIGQHMNKNSREIFGFFRGPFSQAGRLITELLKKHISEPDQLSFSKQILESTKSFDFVMEISSWMRSGTSLEQKMYPVDHYIELAKILIARAKLESLNHPIFLTFPDHAPFLLSAWKETNPESLEAYMTDVFEKNPHTVLSLIQCFTPKIISGNGNPSILSDFKKENYEYLTNIIDSNLIIKSIHTAYSDEEMNQKPNMNTQWDGGQTDLNLISQYLFLDNDAMQKLFIPE